MKEKIKRFELRLSEKEDEQLERKAKQAGLTKSALLRKHINNEPVLEQELWEQLRDLDIAMARIGNNVNQIARKWNESGSDYRDIAFLRAQLGEMYLLMQEVRRYCYSAHSCERE